MSWRGRRPSSAASDGGGGSTRPPARVFRALYQYLPLRDSPNEQPQLELALNPGDLVLVRGEMDSDGFYRGETLDGLAGLVPSNYVERVPDSVLGSARCSSPSFAVSIPAHLHAIRSEYSDPLQGGGAILPDSVCPYPPVDVSRVTVQEMRPAADAPRVPAPRELIVEKKMSRSVVVSWQPPEESLVAISQYHVCVDGGVRAIVPASYKPCTVLTESYNPLSWYYQCRALVEDLPLDGSLNLSVRAVTEHGHSADAACSLSLGNEAAVAPQHVRVWGVTPVSASVTWYPSNSNAEHVISLNAVKVGVCPPSVFQVQLQGLAPSTIYRVSIRTKHPKAVLEQRPVERCLDFKTLPKIGLPEPPVNVQCEAGPQPSTLLVSWTPNVSQPRPPSRAAVHSYLVYADGKNIAQVTEPTADHVLLRLADLSDDPPLFLTVRTRTREGAVSSDSNVARVPRQLHPQHPASIAALPLQPLQPLQTLPTLLHQASYPQGSLPRGAHCLPPTHHLSLDGIGGPLTDPGGVPMAASYPTYPHAYATTGYSSAYGTLQRGATGYPGYTAASTAAAGGGGPHVYPGAYDTLGMVGAGAGVGVGGVGVGAVGLGGVAGVGGVAAMQPGMTGTWKSSHGVPLSAVAHPSVAAQPALAQYYTFHPRLLRGEGAVGGVGGGEEARPSVLEMENSYLLRHRQSTAADWPGTSDPRARMEAYVRGGGRTASAELPASGVAPGTRHRLVPPRLARVKSESGFGTRSEPDLRPAPLDEDCRWFVALFDYNHHMSPNANAENEELSFRKHQLIKVYGEVDPDGFYHGQLGSRYGLVPSNMVIEIAKDDMVPRRTRNEAVPSGAEPALRRMRWGSLKSRSYDHAGDRRYHRQSEYQSLDRRGEREREHSGGRAYRRGGSRDREWDRRGEYDEEYSRDRDRYRDRQTAAGASGEYYDEPPRERRRDREYRDDYRERDRYREHNGHGGGGATRGGDYDYNAPPVPRHEPLPQTSAAPTAMMGGAAMGGAPMGGAAMGGASMGGTMPMQGGMGQPMMGQMPQMQQPMAMGMQGVGSAGQMAQLNQQMAGMQMGGASMGGAMGMGMDDGRLNGGMMRQMVAKFDYDSRQLSPNVDAEQVELSFRQGDVITVYGEMDEDGFFMGELNGSRGLVPSNFLQTSPLTHLAPSQPTEPRKGVAFSEGASVSAGAAIKKATPARQTSQGSAGTATKTAVKKTTTAGAAGKPLAKKMSDVGKGGTPAVRKTSTAVKKAGADTAKKKG